MFLFARKIKSSGRNNYSYKYRAPRNRLPMTREKNFFIAFVIVIFKYYFWCIFEVHVCLIGIYLRVVGKNYKNGFFDFENEIKWKCSEILDPWDRMKRKIKNRFMHYLFCVRSLVLLRVTKRVWKSRQIWQPTIHMCVRQLKKNLRWLYYFFIFLNNFN